jgi:hypothetical protein
MLNSLCVVVSWRLCVTLFSSLFAPLPLCAFAFRFPLFLCFSVSLCYAFLFCLFSASFPCSRRQMSKLAGGESLPSTRRFWQMQRHAPSLPPFTIRYAAPASRLPAVHSSGNMTIIFLKFAQPIFYKRYKMKTSSSKFSGKNNAAWTLKRTLCSKNGCRMVSIEPLPGALEHQSHSPYARSLYQKAVEDRLW